MRATREEQKAEALKRLRKLDLDRYIIDTFMKGSVVICSRPNEHERDKNAASMREAKELINQIRDIEKRRDIMVYVAIETNARTGLLYDLLFVGIDKQDWGIDLMLLEDNVTMSCRINISVPALSEIEIIKIAKFAGILYRVE